MSYKHNPGHFPSEIIALIHVKKQREEEDAKIDVFNEHVIPEIYFARYIYDEESLQTIGNLIVKGKDDDINDQYKLVTSFTLTALKRTCKRLRAGVARGSVNDTYCTVKYILVRCRESKFLGLGDNPL